MPAVPVRVRCACGAAASATLAQASDTLACPGCGRTWAPDPAAFDRAARATSVLAGLRRAATAILAVAVVIAVVVGLARPSWLIGVPVVLAATAMLARPTWRRRWTDARAVLAEGVPLAVR